MSVKRWINSSVGSLGVATLILLSAAGATAKPLFHKVSFSILVPNRASGVYTTSNVSFPYVLSRRGVKPLVEGEQGPSVTLFSAKHNDCSSVHAEVLLGQQHPGGATYPYLTQTSASFSVVQQSRPAVKSVLPFESPGSIVTRVVPGQPWAITVSAIKPSGNPIGSMEAFINGYASCRSSQKL